MTSFLFAWKTTRMMKQKSTANCIFTTKLRFVANFKCYFKTFTFIVKWKWCNFSSRTTDSNWIALANWWSIDAFSFQHLCSLGFRHRHRHRETVNKVKMSVTLMSSQIDRFKCPKLNVHISLEHFFCHISHASAPSTLHKLNVICW